MGSESLPLPKEMLTIRPTFSVMPSLCDSEAIGVMLTTDFILDLQMPLLRS